MKTSAEFLSGVCMAMFFVAAIFFLKFWLASRDRLFLFFCLSMSILAGERVVLMLVREFSFSSNPTIAESNSWVYCMRLFAFVVIMVAIVDKNRHWLERKKKGT